MTDEEKRHEAARWLIEEKGFPIGSDLGPASVLATSLRSILPVTNSDNVKELVEKARTLTRTHLDTEVKQLKAGLTSMEELKKHTHRWRLISFYRCEDCGEKSKIKPQDGEIIE